MKVNLYLSGFFIVSLIGYNATLSANDPVLNILSFGGVYGQLQQQRLIDPYSKKTGETLLFNDVSHPIEPDSNGIFNETVADIINIEAIDVVHACQQGWLASFSHTIFINKKTQMEAKKDFFPQAISDQCGIGMMMWAHIYAFNEHTIGKIYPEKMADVFDIKKIPGKRAFKQRPQVNLEWALLADGVNKEDVYTTLATEEGQHRAFAKLNTIKDNIIWFTQWPQAEELLNDGVATIVQSPNGFIYHAINKNNQPYHIVWNDHISDIVMWSVSKKSQYKQAAFDFIHAVTQPKALATMSEQAYSPTRYSSMAFVSPNVIPFLPQSNAHLGLRANPQFWAKHKQVLTKKFNQWLYQPPHSPISLKN